MDIWRRGNNAIFALLFLSTHRLLLQKNKEKDALKRLCESLKQKPHKHHI